MPAAEPPPPSVPGGRPPTVLDRSAQRQARRARRARRNAPPRIPSRRASGRSAPGLAEDRVLRILCAATGTAYIAFGALALPDVFDQLPARPWNSVIAYLLIVLSGTAIGVLSPLASPRVLRRTAGVAFGCYLLVLVAWQITWPRAMPDPTSTPWVLTVAAVPAAAISLWRPDLVAWAGTLLLALLTGSLRYTASDGDAVLALQNSLYALLISAIFVGFTLVTQYAAMQIDAAAEAARLEGARSASRRARLRERARIDGLVHDGVISSLLMAAQAPRVDPAVASQARATLADLDELRRPDEVTAPPEAALVAASALFRHLQETAQRLGPRIELIDAWRPAPLTLPAVVVETLGEAAGEALRNSVQHAGGYDVRRIAVVTGDEHSVSVRVTDDGSGFDRERIPAPRLGIAVSIERRMEDLPGGWASVDSAPGQGATVVVGWARGGARSTERDSSGEGVTGRGSRRGGEAGDALPDLGRGVASRRAFFVTSPLPTTSYDVLRLGSLEARALLVLGVVVHSHLALTAFAVSPAPVVSIFALVAFAVSGVWVLWPTGDPFPFRWTAGLLALLTGAVIAQSTQVPVDGAPEYANWQLGAATFVLLVLVMRGRIAAAWTGWALMVVVTTVWAAGGGGGPLLVVDLTIRHAATLLIGTLFAVWFRSAARDLDRLQRDRRRRSAQEAEASSAAAERTARLSELDALARPLLERIRAGGSLDDATRSACLRAESALRDSLRGRRLDAEPLRSAVRAARERGVEVSLLDDAGDADPSPETIAKVAACAIREIDELDAGRLVVRLLPAERGLAGSVLVDGTTGRVIDVPMPG